MTRGRVSCVIGDAASVLSGEVEKRRRDGRDENDKRDG